MKKFLIITLLALTGTTYKATAMSDLLSNARAEEVASARKVQVEKVLQCFTPQDGYDLPVVDTVLKTKVLNLNA